MAEIAHKLNFYPSPPPSRFLSLLPRCATKNHKTTSEINSTTLEAVFSISEVEKITSEVNRTTSEVNQIISEEVIKSSRRWTKPPPFFNTKPKSSAPLLYPLFSRTRARITRAHYTYNPTFFAFTAFTIHRKTPRNRLIRLYDLCFSTLPFTIFLHLCLHPYSLDFQPLSPIGEGVKAICTHYYSVYARAKERDGRKEMGGMSLPSERKGTEESEKGGRSTKNGNTPSHDGTFPHRTY